MWIKFLKRVKNTSNDLLDFIFLFSIHTFTTYFSVGLSIWAKALMVSVVTRYDTYSRAAGRRTRIRQTCVVST